MTWTMATNPLGNLGLSALVAALPILYFFWALAIKRMKGHWTAMSGTAIAVIIAIFVYKMPAQYAILSTVYGMLFGLWPVVWIVITAVFLYNLSVKTGQFEIIKNSLASMSDDRRLQALLIAFSFGAFIEGAAGFGTPVAITGAMLAGLGFNPLYAAGICLIANTAPVAFGAIGIPIVVAGQVSGVDTMAISQMVGRTLPFLSLIIPFYVAIVMAGWKKGIEVWPACLVSGGSFALAQFASSNFLGPLLPDIIASITSIVCLGVFLKLWHPKESWRFANEPASKGKELLRYTGGQVFRAWAPFILLSVFVAAWGVKPIQAALNKWATFPFHMPGLDNMIIRGGKPMGVVYNLNTLGAAGTAILLTAIFSMPVMGASVSTSLKVFGQTCKTLKWAIVAISFVLGFAFIMNFSGMATTLGYAFAETGRAFPFFAPFLGWLGVFMTGSDTSSNALFGKLHEVTATKIGVDPVITVAANSSGGVCGKMISPQSLSVATAAVGLVGHESDIFRFTLKHSILLTAVIAAMAYLQSNVLGFLVPTYAKGAAAVAAAAAAAPSVADGIKYLIITAVVVLVLVGGSTMAGRTATAGRAEPA
jgi:lactate permease